MRSTVTLLTMVATVMHLAVGCCVHAEHAGVGRMCCAGEPAAVHEADCGCDHRHGDAAPAAGGERGATESDAPRSAAMRGSTLTPPLESCDDCGGCHCVATRDAEGTTALPQPVGGGVVSAAGRDTPLRHPCRRRGAADAPVLAALLPPLFGRLLV